MVVVLLNILIAQFSKSYEEETERAQINVIITRTDIILKMEHSPFKHPCVRVSLFCTSVYYALCSSFNAVCEETEDHVY